VIYVGNTDHDLYALDAITGTQLWTFSSEGAILAALSVRDSTVYFGSTDDTCMLWMWASNAK
jgi:eukaryotic-like serine/threonine-protein kinase